MAEGSAKTARNSKLVDIQKQDSKNDFAKWEREHQKNIKVKLDSTFGKPRTDL